MMRVLVQWLLSHDYYILTVPTTQIISTLFFISKFHKVSKSKQVPYPYGICHSTICFNFWFCSNTSRDHLSVELLLAPIRNGFAILHGIGCGTCVSSYEGSQSMSITSLFVGHWKSICACYYNYSYSWIAIQYNFTLVYTYTVHTYHHVPMDVSNTKISRCKCPNAIRHDGALSVQSQRIRCIPEQMPFKTAVLLYFCQG